MSEDTETNEQAEETWEKFDPRKQKAINPIHLSNAKNTKKLNRDIKSIQDFIKVEPNDNESATRVNLEHAYCIPNPILQTQRKENVKVSTALQQEEKCKNIYDMNMLDQTLNSTCQSKHKEKIEYLLFRYNDIYNLIYPNLEQFEMGFHNFMNTQDWESLQEGNWLTNIAVNCAILSSIKENFQNTLSLPCQINEINFKNVNKLISLKPALLFIPILQKNHFHLCVLKPETQEFIFIDSLYNSTGRSYFKNLISNKCIDMTWKLATISKRLTQKDSSSCGVFVILYVINFLKNLPMTTIPFSNPLRDEIKSMLVRNADNSSKFCCHCGNSKKYRKKCFLCNYHVCKDCMLNKYNSFTTFKICTNNILN